jgi:hypothetical protein
MSSAYTNYNDRPNQIQLEGQQISLILTINGDGTALVTWNIPPPANGCTAESQAYNGIVITAATQPANYLTTSPSDGFMYTGDPTVDPNLFTGDILGSATTETAMVVGAFYNDKTTTSLTLTGLSPTSFYYISAYAVDIVGRYYREGVHAYSLATGVQKPSTPDTSGYQDIGINAPTETHLKTSTGLAPNIDYVLHFRANSKAEEIYYNDGGNVTAFYGQDYFITIPGREALSFDTLIQTLNNKFALLDKPYEGPTPPNEGTYYYNNGQLYFYDGFTLVLQTTLTSINDPSQVTINQYWYNPSTNNSYVWDGSGWTLTPLINNAADITQPNCGDLWFNGSTAYEWDGDVWYQLKTFIQNFNPLLAPVLSCNTYWYDQINSYLYQWNTGTGGWETVSPIDSPIDPNTISTGVLWFNQTNSVLSKYVAGSWNVLEYRTDAPIDQSDDINFMAAGIYWLNPVNNQLYKRDPTNSFWILQQYVTYGSDPTIRNSGDLWWNQSPSVNTLYIWDSLNMVWVVIEAFIQSTYDPSQPPALSNNAAWYNPLTGILTYLQQSSCIQKNTIFTPFNPLNTPTGTVWYNSTNFYVRENGQWTQIYPYIYNSNPYSLTPGFIWINPTTQTIRSWSGTEFLQINYSDTSPLPNTPKTYWYNTTNNTLYVWENMTWTQTIPKVRVTLNKPDIFNYRYTSFLRFMTRETGCQAFFEIIPEETGLCSYMQPTVIYHDPVPGGTGTDAGPSYKQLGVGTDGSPDTRRQIQSELRRLLGGPSVVVELTKEQLDICIDYALLTLRKYSSYAYRRFMFFVDMMPNQQIYYMTNKCVGFNKITQVNGIFRLKSAFFRTGFAGNDMFGFAALQQLYTIGSFDMVAFHLMSQYIELLEQLFATKVMYQFVEERRELRLYQAITYKERMLVDANIEKTEQQLFDFRETSVWLKKWALAEAKKMLSQVRGKYTTLPGPNGSTTLNGQELAAQAESEMRALMEQLYDPAMQDLNDVGERAHFIQG